MKHRFSIQLRYGDTDALGHLNNAVYASMAELARIDFLQQLGVPVENLILARLALDYRRQVRFGDSVEVLTWIERLGSSSMHLRHEVMCNTELATEISSVVVYYDYEQRSPAPLPEKVRETLTHAIL